MTEGYATAATVYECTRQPVAVAFDCENLLDVALAMRWKYRQALIVLCADDDWRSRGNPGLTKARQAAFAVNGVVAIPFMPTTRRGPKDTDFNDMARLLGGEAVKSLLRRVVRSGQKRLHRRMSHG